MTTKKFGYVVGVIFILIAAAHALRITMGWDAYIGDWDIPIWFSWIAVLLGGYLGYWGFRVSKRG